MTQELCTQCQKRPPFDWFNDERSTIWQRAFKGKVICFECGMMNVARSFETDNGDDPSLKDISDGEQAGAYFRAFVPQAIQEEIESKNDNKI